MGEYRFDAARARDGLVAAIRALADRQRFERVVIGISGGKDSTVCAALCARALGPESFKSPSAGRATSTSARGCA